MIYNKLFCRIRILNRVDSLSIKNLLVNGIKVFNIILMVNGKKHNIFSNILKVTLKIKQINHQLLF